MFLLLTAVFCYAPNDNFVIIFHPSSSSRIHFYTRGMSEHFFSIYKLSNGIISNLLEASRDEKSIYNNHFFFVCTLMLAGWCSFADAIKWINKIWKWTLFCSYMRSSTNLFNLIASRSSASHDINVYSHNSLARQVAFL